jgi:hypothetical protein
MLSLARFFVLVVVAGALAACASPGNTSLPPGVSVQVLRRAQGLTGVAFTFRVNNESGVALQQTLLRSYCMVKVSGSAAIPAHSTRDEAIEVSQSNDCRVASSMTDGFEEAGGPTRRRAEFTFDYVRSNSGFGKPSIPIVGRGWNGLCGGTFTEDATKVVGFRIFEGQAPAAGCYTTPAISPDAAKSFKLVVENATGSPLSALTVSSLCISGAPGGTILPGSAKLYALQTTAGVWCNYAADFVSELSISEKGRRTPVGVVTWEYDDPNSFKVEAIGTNGYCGIKLIDTQVRFYKMSGTQC